VIEKQKEKANGKSGVFEEATLFGYFKNYLAFMNSAVKEGYISPLDSNFNSFELYENFKPRINPRPISIQAIKKIAALDLEPKSRLWNSRNYFLFSFYANGINFKDLAMIERGDIIRDGMSWQRNKTGVDCVSILNPEAKKIIDSYKGLTYGNYIFPILTKDYDLKQLHHRLSSVRTQINTDLKTIQKLADLDAEITFYTSRHSYVSILQDIDVPDNEIGTLIGQSEGKALRNYLKRLSVRKAGLISQKVYDLISEA
jgi:integrase/recombinase XerD